MFWLYSLVVALVAGSTAAFVGVKIGNSRWVIWIVALLLSAVLAVGINVGVLLTMSTLAPDAPFDANSGGRAAGTSVWLSLLFAIVCSNYFRKKRNLI